MGAAKATTSFVAFSHQLFTHKGECVTSQLSHNVNDNGKPHSDGQNKNVAKRLSGTPLEAVPTGLGKNGESPLALQRRPSQVSAPHPKTKSYATDRATTTMSEGKL